VRLSFSKGFCAGWISKLDQTQIAATLLNRATQQAIWCHPRRLPATAHQLFIIQSTLHVGAPSRAHDATHMVVLVWCLEEQHLFVGTVLPDHDEVLGVDVEDMHESKRTGEYFTHHRQHEFSPCDDISHEMQVMHVFEQGAD